VNLLINLKVEHFVLKTPDSLKLLTIVIIDANQNFQLSTIVLRISKELIEF